MNLVKESALDVVVSISKHRGIGGGRAVCCLVENNCISNLNIDISIMERSENVCVQEGHFGWADMGTWASLFVDAPSDAQGNVLLNTPAFLYDCQNNVIRLPNGRTAVVKGLQDYVIAEEGEILMICPRADVAAMRKMHTDTKFS